MTTISKQEIEHEMTEKGGYNKKTLTKWGVPWPPPKGWKLVLVKQGIPYKYPIKVKEET